MTERRVRGVAGRLLLIALLALPLTLHAQAQRTLDSFVPLHGRLVICGGGELPDAVIDAFVDAAGGAAGRLVVIPTASATADDPAAAGAAIARWRDRGIDSVSWLHTRDRAVADRLEFVRVLDAATAVWIGGGDQTRLSDVYLGTAVETALHALLARGGTIGGTSAGAAVQSRVMIRGGHPEPSLGTGLGLLPGTVVDQHFRRRQREPRLRAAIARHPSLVGLGIDEGTALLVHGRSGLVIGAGGVTTMLSRAVGRPADDVLVPAGGRIDLLRLVRAAAERAAGKPFPCARREVAVAGTGGLLLVARDAAGAGPPGWPAAFVARAGGPAASIVVVGCSRESADADATALRHAGATAVEVLAPVLRGKPTAAVAAVTRAADAVWLVDGAIADWIDCGEPFLCEALRSLLEDGGLVGGRGGGAGLLGDALMFGASREGEALAEGYTQGFGLLQGCAVDPASPGGESEPPLRAVTAAHPDLLGLGLEPGAILFITGRSALVQGDGRVWLFDRRGGAGPGEGRLPPRELAFQPGERIDFTTSGAGR